MPEISPRPARGRWIATLVLALSLAATVFAWWRESELQQRNQQLRWQESYAPVGNMLRELLMVRFEVLHDQTRAALRRGNFTAAAWQEFADQSEWRQHFPGISEIGYAEFDGEKCYVKFISTAGGAALHPAGFDLTRDPAIREAALKSRDAGYGIPSRPINTGDTNAAMLVVCFLTVQRIDARPGTVDENRQNLRGLVFFALDQREYFGAVAKEMRSSPFEFRLLRPDEPAIVKTPTQRTITNGGMTGEWRFAVTLKAAPAAGTPWLVLVLGLGLSGLLFWLVSVQARLRAEAEAAREKAVAQEAEILALNRELEQKVAQRTLQLNEALAEERELNQLKSNFIAMVSHEIRTPLALILSSAEILSRYLDRLAPEKRARHLEQINESVERMSSLMEDVLLFSKAEAGRMEFNPASLQLTEFLPQLVDEMSSTTARRCPIELELGPSLAEARGDEALLRHILSNLLSNAVKYSAAGEAVKLRVRREAGEAVFEVIDRGIGISEADREKLFRPFHRGANAKHIAGTGLGLVIVRRCVERHGGSFDIQSRENAGTTATVRLPMFSPAHTEFVKKFN
ncbi:MAG: hypothetical protein RLY20_203 [Verrucomicrobiota bacterium]|jgi:signal transduction histidine kinase